MPTQQDIKDQLEQLQLHRDNLRFAQKQMLRLGGPTYAQPAVQRSINDAYAGIARCKAVLCSWDIQVEDLPTDFPPPEPPLALSEGKVVNPSSRQDTSLRRRNLLSRVLKSRTFTLSAIVSLSVVILLIYGYIVVAPYYLVRDGTLLAGEGKTDQAIEQFELALSLNPRSAEAYYQIAEIYRKSNYDNKAIEYYKKAIEIQPENSKYLYRLGNLLINYPESLNIALDYLLLSKENDPSNPEIYNEIGYIYIKYGWTSKAKNILLEGKLRVNPPYNAQIIKNLANVELSDNNIEKAIEYYNEAINLDTRGMLRDAKSGLAKAYQKKGDIAMACQTLASSFPDAEVIYMQSELQCKR